MAICGHRGRDEPAVLRHPHYGKVDLMAEPPAGGDHRAMGSLRFRELTRPGRQGKFEKHAVPLPCRIKSSSKPRSHSPTAPFAGTGQPGRAC